MDPGATLASSVMGAAAGLSLAVAGVLGIQAGLGKEGMGYGDFKLFAALGAWLGGRDLVLIILMSSVISCHRGHWHEGLQQPAPKVGMCPSGPFW